ncbi:MAG: sigma-70 family RNA polymerase sigma factor [Verrucomicrobiota bacterium]
MDSSSQAPPPSSSSGEADEVNQRSVALMALVAQGDHGAFRELVELHQNLVVGTVAKMLGSASDAEDLSQQVFLRVWKSAPRYQPSAKFTTWLFTITRNLVFNEVRRRQRKPSVSLEEQEEERNWEPPSEKGLRPDQSTLQSELEEQVDKAIASLPEKQRLAVILRRYEEVPYEEIASILGLSLSAVKSLLFRARGQLKEQLKAYLREDDDERW